MGSFEEQRFNRNSYRSDSTSSIIGEMDARFDDLNVFEAILRTGSLSSAARELHRSTSSVTRSLERLENGLGSRLFHRTTRVLSLTDEGRRFVPYAEAMRTALSRAEVALGETVRRVKGTLRLTVSATFARFYLAPVLADLRKEHPELKLELLLTDDVVDLVEAGLDAGIRIGPLENSSLSAVKLSEDRRVLVASPELLAQFGSPSRPAELNRLPCLTLGGRSRWPFKSEEIQVNVVMNANLGDFVLEGACSGLGFARLATWLAGPSIRCGQLVPVLEAFAVPSDGAVAIVTPTREGRPARVRALIAAVRRHLVPAPWMRTNEFADESTIL